MKNLIVCLTLACLASLPLARAGEGKSSATNKSAGADKAKAMSSAKIGCSDTAGCGVSNPTSCTEKSSCCDKERIARKVTKPVEKGATFLVKR